METDAPEHTAPTGRSRSLLVPVVAFGALVAVAFAVVGLSVARLDLFDDPAPHQPYPDEPWLDGWVRWDAGWYNIIAVDGYSYTPGHQSPVAFFPAYPLAMRGLGEVTGDVLVAGIVLTVVCGFGVATLYFLWCRRRLSPRSTVAALAVLLLYPYSYYLFGAVYADALFIVAVLGAFLLAEDDRPVLAGIVGAVATAARPVGGALVIGLVLVVLHRRGALDRAVGPVRARLRRVRPLDAAVLLSAVGIAAYCFYLWARFDEPFAFLDQTGVPGWDQSPGPETWFKIDFIKTMREPQSLINYVRFSTQAVFTVGALALVPAVVKRFGWAYGAYVLVIVGIPAISTKDFTGMGRYLLAAFPCYAAAGDILASRRWLRVAAVPTLAASAALLLVFTSAFSRGYYLS